MRVYDEVVAITCDRIPAGTLGFVTRVCDNGMVDIMFDEGGEWHTRQNAVRLTGKRRPFSVIIREDGTRVEKYAQEE